MKPSGLVVYLTSSSDTREVLTVTKDWSRAIIAAARRRIIGSKTTSPFIQRTPPGPEARSARRRLLDVFVWSYCSL